MHSHCIFGWSQTHNKSNFYCLFPVFVFLKWFFFLPQLTQRLCEERKGLRSIHKTNNSHSECKSRLYFWADAAAFTCRPSLFCSCSVRFVTNRLSKSFRSAESAPFLNVTNSNHFWYSWLWQLLDSSSREMQSSHSAWNFYDARNISISY